MMTNKKGLRIKARRKSNASTRLLWLDKVAAKQSVVSRPVDTRAPAFT